MLTCLHMCMHTHTHTHKTQQEIKKLVALCSSELWRNSEWYSLLLVHSLMPTLKQIPNYAAFFWGPAYKDGLRRNHNS